MTRLIVIRPDEQAEVARQVEAHLAAGGAIIDLPRWMLHGAAGFCPQRNYSSLQHHCAPAIAAVSVEERVDIAQVVSRLNGVRSRLATTLGTQASLAERRAIEHAERKTRSKLRGQTAERFNGFPDMRAVNSVGGVAAMLDGAWTAVNDSMKASVTDASREKAAILAASVSQAEAEVQAEQYRRRGIEATAFLLSLLAARAEGRISGEKRIPPLGPAIRRASQYIEGASGSLDQDPHKGPPRLPPDVFAVVSAAPEQRLAWTWIHSFYGVPIQPFDPHVEIDANIYSSAELEDINWFPGDHVGCLCETIPELGFA